MKVTTSVEPQRVTIGTPFRYTMRVEAPAKMKVVIPLLVERIGGFSVTDFGENPTREENGRVIVERWYTLVAYETGDQVVPGPSVQYQQNELDLDLQTVHAPDTLVIVESVLDAKNRDALPDVKPPVAVPGDYRPLIFGGAALAAFVGGGLAIYWLLNRGKRVPAVPPRPAHEIALDALAELRRAGLIEAGAYKEFYFRLSGIVRAYVEGRFQLRAPEMTTEEFLQAAQRNTQLAQQHRATLAQFLGEADLVKFARHVPTVQDAERALRAAGQFVESTRPQPEVPRAAA